MNVLIIGVVLSVLGYFFGKGIRKNSTLLYVLALVFGIVALVIGDKVKVTEMFIDGYIGTALFIIVMYTGAFKKKSNLSKKFMSIRREYSILGFIFLLPHMYVYLIEFYSDLTLIESWVGILAFIIMIPLFITSFQKYRKRYTFPQWKKLHRWSYLAYTLIYVHLLLVADSREIIVYSIIFIPYLLMKLMKEYKINETKKVKAIAS